MPFSNLHNINMYWRFGMITNMREFEQARERDLDRAVEEHYAEEDEEDGE